MPGSTGVGDVNEDRILERARQRQPRPEAFDGPGHDQASGSRFECRTLLVHLRPKPIHIGVGVHQAHAHLSLP